MNYMSVGWIVIVINYMSVEWIVSVMNYMSLGWIVIVMNYMSVGWFVFVMNYISVGWIVIVMNYMSVGWIVIVMNCHVHENRVCTPQWNINLNIIIAWIHTYMHLPIPSCLLWMLRKFKRWEGLNYEKVWSWRKFENCGSTLTTIFFLFNDHWTIITNYYFSIEMNV